MMKKMNEIDTFTIFSNLKTLGKIELLNDIDSAVPLDTQYFYGVSNNKWLNNFFINLLENDTNYEITIATIFNINYADNLNKMYGALMSDYDPISNYNSVEDENIGSEIVVSSSADNKVFGFNTDVENPVPSAEGKSDNTTTGDYDNNHRHVEKSGNIGVTTSQQMINSEIELRRFNLIKYMYSLMDELLCLQVR